MPPLCSWEQELWTVLCCTSLEKDRGISVPRILVLLLLSSDPRLTRHGRVCSVARWYSIAATQSREAFRLLQCLCPHTCAGCLLHNLPSLTPVCALSSAMWSGTTTLQFFPLLFYPPCPLSSSCPALQDCFCTLPALWGLFCLSFSLCPLPPPPYTGCDAPSAVRFPLYPLGLVFSMLPRPSSQPGAFTLERKATFYFHSFL